MKPPPPVPKAAKDAPRERTVEIAVRDYAKSRGWLCFKWISPGNNGVPDRIFFRAGRTLIAEIKRPGGKTTKLQDVQINALRRAGMEVHVIDDAHPALLSLIFD
jgi:hypothetical protein